MSDLLDPTKGFIFGSFLFNHSKISKEQCLELWKYQSSETFEPDDNPLFDYYTKEMGAELSRFFIIDFTPTSRDEFVPAKLWADSLEREHMIDGRRTINLDIGFLALENFQLATGKPYSHRVYLRDGVFSDLTYIFEKKTFSSLPWTYPDYRHEQKIQKFNQWRSSLAEALRF
jgi:hypothetical protein